MMDRKLISTGMAVVALVVMVVTYGLLPAPWGNPPVSEEASNPTLIMAPFMFILGIILLFLSPVVSELIPDEEEQEETDG